MCEAIEYNWSAQLDKLESIHKSKHQEISTFLKKFVRNNLDYPKNISELSRVDQIKYVITNTNNYLKIMKVDHSKLETFPDPYFYDFITL